MNVLKQYLKGVDSERKAKERERERERDERRDARRDEKTVSQPSSSLSSERTRVEETERIQRPLH